MNREERINYLEFRIKLENEAYRKGEPNISDSEYDSMVDELKELDPTNEIFDSGVIEEINDVEEKESRKEKIEIPMYSLDKLTSFEELVKWITNKRISRDEILVITPKFDGISLLNKNKNKKQKTWKRGDGSIGQKSSIHFERLSTNKIYEDCFCIGEAIMPTKTFNDNTFLKSDGTPYNNARNMVAGLFNADDARDYLTYVDFVPYGVLFGEKGEIEKNKVDQLTWLNDRINFKYEYEVITFNNLELYSNGNVEDYLFNLYEKWNNNPYEIDGLVIEVNSSEVRETLGRESNNNPVYAKAYKGNFEEVVESKVEGIERNTSKWGLSKPVILIETVNLGGANVSRATGYNAAYIIDNNIAKGSVIKIKRSGDVIPKHLSTVSFVQEEVDKLSKEIMICTSCGETMEWTENVVDLVCKNPNCGTKLLKKNAFFFTVFEVEDFGQPTVKKLMDSGCKTISEILNMTESDISSIDGLGHRSSKNIVDQFNEKIKNGVPFEKLGHASGCFEGLGKKKLIKLALYWKGKKDTLTSLKELQTTQGQLNYSKEMIKVDGLAERTIEQFLDGVDCFVEFATDINIKIIEENMEKKINQTEEYQNRVFVFSGFRDKELQQEIEDGGGRIASSISGKVTDLVVKDKTQITAKVKKAQSLEINIIERGSM